MYKDSSSSNAEVLNFDDCASGWVSQVASTVEDSMNYGVSNTTNDGFLGRPVKILSFQWPLSVFFSQKFDPWSLFCEDPRVVNRLAHFKNLRGNLHLKFVLNGNPFYYGRLLAAYTPMVSVDNYSPTTTPSNLGEISLLSQKPHLWLNPTTSEGGDLVCEYVYPKNFVNITKREWNRLGEITIVAVNGLRHANGSTETVTVSVFAYMTEVVLSGPTAVLPAVLSPQGDEYGIISGPAATLANWSGKLSDAPYIGKYARATNIASSAISGIAQLFGFSRPRQLDIQQCHVVYGPEVSVTSGSDTCKSLALDPKKEITVDPRVVFSNKGDEMALVPLACRQSFLTYFDWNVNQGPDTHLMSFRVTPVQGSTFSTTTYITPSAWVAMPFEYWTGSMLYRFQVVASAYHRGRLRIVWDPEFYKGSAYNTVYSHIVDISANSDFTVKVGWGQDTNYMRVLSPAGSEFNSYSATPYTDNPGSKYNGALHVSIVNELTCPQAAGEAVYVNVFTSMCEDFEVHSPSDLFSSGLTNLITSDDPPQPPAVTAPALPPVTNPILVAGSNSGQQTVSNIVLPLVLKTVPAAVALMPRWSSAARAVFPQYSQAIGVDTTPGRGSLLVDGPAAQFELYTQSAAAGPVTLELTFENASTNARTITISEWQGSTYTATLSATIGATTTMSLPFTFKSGGHKAIPFTMAVAGGGGRIVVKTAKVLVGTTHEPKLLDPTAMKALIWTPSGNVNSTVVGTGSAGRLNTPADAPKQYFKYPQDWVAGSRFTIESADNLAVGFGTNLFTAGNKASPSGTGQTVVAWDPWTTRGTDPNFTPGDTTNKFISVTTISDVVASDGQNIPIDGDLSQIWYWQDTSRAVGSATIDTFDRQNILPEGDVYGETVPTTMENAPVKEVPDYFLGPTDVCSGAQQIYFGEQAASWRQLLKRYTFWMAINPLQAHTIYRLPSLPIPISNISNANGSTSRITVTMHEWVSSAYLAKRGSGRILLAKSTSSTANILRHAVTTILRRPSVNFGGASISNGGTFSPQYSANWNGSALENMGVTATIQAEAPYYSHYRFVPSRSTFAGSDDSLAIARDNVSINVVGNSDEVYSLSWAAGEDFSLSHFICTPRIAWNGIS